MTQQSPEEKQQPKTVEYVISVLHKRPELGESSEFVSTYYAKEGRSARYLKRVFLKAFKKAHPSWAVEEIVVSPSKEVLG